MNKNPDLDVDEILSVIFRHTKYLCETYGISKSIVIQDFVQVMLLEDKIKVKDD